VWKWWSFLGNFKVDLWWQHSLMFDILEWWQGMLGSFGESRSWDWKLSTHYYASFEWGVCPYYGNFVITVGHFLYALGIVTKLWAGNISLVKNINVGVLGGMVFMRGWGWSLWSRDGNNMSSVLVDGVFV